MTLTVGPNPIAWQYNPISWVRFGKKAPPTTGADISQGLVNSDRLTDTFIRLAKVDSGSQYNAAALPSTEGQLTLGRILIPLLSELDVQDIQIDKHGLVTGTVPSNLTTDHANEPVLGLISHLDTSPDAPSKNVQPRMHRNYQGGAIKLDGGTRIKAKYLKAFKGQDIITSDGTTLLGADDKAGIAEILEMLAILKANPKLKHPKLRIAFTPDEETSAYIDQFDIKGFGATVAYTVDGSSPASIDRESFNAHKITLNIKGNPVHPGNGRKGGLVNALLLANEITNQLPKRARPETTDGRQGYYFVHSINGTAEEAKMNIMIRDFSYARSLQRIERVRAITERIKKRYKKAQITMTSEEQYRNMGPALNKHPQVVKNAEEAIRRIGLTPQSTPVRGGTDGSNLSVMGLPSPNIGGGGQLYHSKREFISVQSMVDSVRMMLNLLQVWAEHAEKQRTT